MVNQLETKTPNLELIKPGLSSYVQIDDLNTNADIIDGAIKDVQDEISLIISDVSDGDKTVENHVNNVVTHSHYGVATGENSYLVNIDVSIDSYIEGMGVVVKIPNDSTANATLDVNGLGAIPIKSADGKPVKDLTKGGIYTLRYTSSAFILQGKGGELNTLELFDQLKHYGKDLDLVIASENRMVLNGGNGYPNGKRVTDLNGTVLYSEMHVTVANYWFVSNEVIGQYKTDASMSTNDVVFKVFTDHFGTELYRNTTRYRLSQYVVGFDTTNNMVYTVHDGFIRSIDVNGTIIATSKYITSYGVDYANNGYSVRNGDVFSLGYAQRYSDKGFTLMFNKDLQSVQLYPLMYPYII